MTRVEFIVDVEDSKKVYLIMQALTDHDIAPVSFRVLGEATAANGAASNGAHLPPAPRSKSKRVMSSEKGDDIVRRIVADGNVHSVTEMKREFRRLGRKPSSYSPSLSRLKGLGEVHSPGDTLWQLVPKSQ